MLLSLAYQERLAILRASVSVGRCANLAFFPAEKHKAGRVLAMLVYQPFSDEPLMEAYRDDDIQAYDILFNRYKDILYRY